MFLKIQKTLKTTAENEAKIMPVTLLNQFMLNIISHRYRLEQSISVLRDDGWYFFQFVFKL